MSSKIVKLGSLKNESIILLASQEHNGFPLLASLAVKYILSDFKNANILTNSKIKWKSILYSSVLKGECKVNIFELFNLPTLPSFDSSADLLVIDNASYSFEKFGSQETISLLLKAGACLVLLQRGLQTDSIVAYIRSIFPYFTSLDTTEEQCMATTFYSYPPRLQKQTETYQISSALQLTSQPFTVSSKQPILSQHKTPSSTFRLETDEDEEAVRTLLSNPFLGSDDPVSQYIAGRGSSDSESDPDDDLNI